MDQDYQKIKTLVGEILSIPVSLDQHWDVLSVYPEEGPAQLALAHYQETYDPHNRSHEPLRRVRGIIIDLTTHKLIADSYGYTQTLACYEPIEDRDSVLRIATDEMMYINRVEEAPEEIPKIKPGYREFAKSDTRLFIGYEGALIRIFKWRNQIFFSTHRRIIGFRSNWGGKESFYNMYTRLGGPQIIFDGEKPVSCPALFGDEESSPYCHIFLIVDNDIRLASSTRDNRLFYVGVKKMEDREIVLKSPPLPPVTDNVFTTQFDRTMTRQPVINVDIANKIMFPSEYAARLPGIADQYPAQPNELIVDYSTEGEVKEVYFNKSDSRLVDERLRGGDFIILYTKTSEGSIIVYRLEPPAAEYRVRVTGNDPNTYHRFVVNMEEFIKNDYPTLWDSYPKYGTNQERTVRDRQIYWWSVLYDAIAPAHKPEVDKFLARYGSDLKKVINFITYEYPIIMDKTDEKGEKEKRLIDQKMQARINDLRRIAFGSSRPVMEKQRVLQSLLIKETGPSFYKMITTIKKLTNFRKNQ